MDASRNSSRSAISGSSSTPLHSGHIPANSKHSGCPAPTGSHPCRSHRPEEHPTEQPTCYQCPQERLAKTIWPGCVVAVSSQDRSCRSGQGRGVDTSAWSLPCTLASAPFTGESRFKSMQTAIFAFFFFGDSWVSALAALRGRFASEDSSASTFTGELATAASEVFCELAWKNSVMFLNFPRRAFQPETRHLLAQPLPSPLHLSWPEPWLLDQPETTMQQNR